MGDKVTYLDVVEGIRAAQATYAQALDDGRIDDLVSVFTEDAVIDLEGMGTLEGRETIRATYLGWKPTDPQRHLISNLLVTDWNEKEATATTDVVMIKVTDGAWGIFMVARYHDTVRNEDGVWRFAKRVTRFAGAAEREKVASAGEG